MLVPTFTKTFILGSKSHVLVNHYLCVGSVGTGWGMLVQCVEQVLSVVTNIHKIIDFGVKNT